MSNSRAHTTREWETLFEAFTRLGNGLSYDQLERKRMNHQLAAALHVPESRVENMIKKLKGLYSIAASPSS